MPATVLTTDTSLAPSSKACLILSRNGKGHLAKTA
eukprot:CAMPEP_0181487226 /NCGR_PEP_ID=MMETSP1110-20121109/47690_1 /TAXON_ID=174948 /ORGANISM="Symbiodinium sp., Strain CCMP421" /LENGTH=34 /DNA_ID= /DNA_START= /DNA_END= /DNA_ORIENTATION=